MGNCEYDRCHARDFCPLREECCGWSNASAGTGVSSVQMAKGDMVWSIDHASRFVYVVRSGLFVTFVPFADGCEHFFALFPRGIVSGIADLWVNEAAAQAYGLRCLVPGVLCRIPADLARTAFEARHDALAVVASLLTNNSSGSLELTRILSEREAPNRLTRLFLTLRDMLPGRRDRRVFRFTQDELALIVSEHRSSISRALEYLEEVGAIERGYGKVTVWFDQLPVATESAQVRSPFFYAD